MTISISDDVKSTIEERGITADDVEEVVNYAEESGDKLIDEGEGLMLAKKRLENFMVYAEYKLDGDTVEVVDGYEHRVRLQEDAD